MNTTSDITPIFTPQTTPIKVQPQKPLPLPLLDAEFPLTPFDITPPHPHISDPSDIDPKLLRNIKRP